MTKAAISLIQTGLRDLGYSPGAIDGLYGAKTAAAAHSWLLARGAASTSVLRPSTSTLIYQGKARYPPVEYDA